MCKQDYAICWCESVRKGLEKDVCARSNMEIAISWCNCLCVSVVYAGVHKHVAGSKDAMIQQWDCIHDHVKVADCRHYNTT